YRFQSIQFAGTVVLQVPGEDVSPFYAPPVGDAAFLIPELGPDRPRPLHRGAFKRARSHALEGSGPARQSPRSGAAWRRSAFRASADEARNSAGRRPDT